jgi:hypothetical protein
LPLFNTWKFNTHLWVTDEKSVKIEIEEILNLKKVLRGLEKNIKDFSFWGWQFSVELLNVTLPELSNDAKSNSKKRWFIENKFDVETRSIHFNAHVYPCECAYLRSLLYRCMIFQGIIAFIYRWTRSWFLSNISILMMIPCMIWIHMK